MIARLDLTAIGELKEALPRFTHKPLPHLSVSKPDQIEGYWLDEIAQELEERMLHCVCIVCRRTHQRSCALRRFAVGHESRRGTSSRH